MGNQKGDLMGIYIELSKDEIKLLKRLTLSHQINEEISYATEMKDDVRLWKFEWMQVLNELDGKINSKGARDKDKLEALAKKIVEYI